MGRSGAVRLAVGLVEAISGRPSWPPWATIRVAPTTKATGFSFFMPQSSYPLALALRLT